MKKRLLASLLSATILLSMTPMAFADEEPVGENLTEPVQAETVEEAVPQAEPQEENNAPVVQEDPKAEETPADIVIDSDTTWSEARTLTGDLTVNSGATLTIGAQVTVSGDVTISGGGTIQRAKSYTGDVANYQENATDKEGNVLDTAPATAHLFYVTEDSSLTVQDICMDGNAGWTLSNAAPVIDNKTELTDYQAQGLTPVIGALICNMGQLTVGDGAVLQNNFNFYQTDLSGTGLGGAVYNAGDMTVTGSAVIQYNSSRYGGGIRNEDGSALLIQGGSIQYNNGSAGAAGIMANAVMDFKMTGGEINGNASPATAGWPVGTGIFFGYGVKATLTGGSITNNVGYHTGAGIYIRFDSDQVDIGKVLISGNQALNDRDNGKYNGKGGGIYAEGGDVTISGATITNNTAEQNGAGVMVGHNDKADHCTVNITGDTEIKNNHGGIGGGVYVASDAECSISGNTKIENNTTGTTVWSTAPSGGGIAVIAKGVLNISENVSIQNNQAVKYGGGIYSNGTVEINGTNVMISGNKAEHGGGILGDGNSNTTITGNVTISNNTAEVMTDTTNIYGGGGCFHSGSTATLSGAGVVLEGNVAKAVTTALKPGNFAVGGGIYFGGNSLTLKDITIRGGLTDGSYNAERGGAIATSGSTVEMTGVTIDGNRALRQGGGIYLNNKSTTITDSTISNNFVDIITTDTETDGIYGSGGGIFTVSSATDCTIQNTKITNNTANALASWLGGGGIYTDGNTAMTLIDCTISGNKAANASGGGIQNRGTLTLQDTTVSNNTAKLSGGGIDHREKTVSVLGSVVISGNTVNGKANNFYPEYRTPPKDNPATPAEFNSNSLVIVTGQLTPGASIGVTLPDQLIKLNATVAKGTDTHTVTSADAAYFTYDGGNKLVQKATDSNTLVLADAAAIRTVTFNLPEQVKVSCANPVEVADGENLTVTFDMAYGYKLLDAYAGESQKLDITNNAITLSNVTDDVTVTVHVDPKAVNVSTNEINGVYGQKLEKQVIETAYYDDEESDLSIIASCEVNADEDQLPEGLELRNDGMLIGTPKEVGTFNLYVDFTADNGQSNGQTVIVEIGKATYDMSGVSFEDATYTYDGKEKTLEISGELPEGVTVSYENNTLTNAGSVKATAEFTVADTEHYNEIDEVLYADLTIETAIPEITISADKATLTGSGTVTLTVEKPEDGKVTVTCDKEGVTVTENEDGTFTATLPNADETYTFTATVKYDETANYVNVDPVTCTVTVTYQSTSHGGGGSSRNNSYAVSTPKADNGSVTVNNGSTAKKGDTVTITVKPDAGYEIDKVTVTDSKGNQITVTDKGDGKFSFVMPDSKVDVKVTFVKSEVKPDQPSKSGFVDVPENSWYADAADFVAQRGLMSGVGENLFGGSQNTTRAMLMTILARMDGQDVTGGATWYEKAMNWAKQTGVSDGTMPEVNITREQLVTMFYSYAKLKGMDPIPNGMALSKFSDADSISTWASEAVSWAAYSGIISGRSNGTVAPQAGATRAEMAVMLQQFVKLMEK